MTLLNAVLQNDTVKVLVLDNHKTAFEYIKEPNTIIAIMAIIVSLLGLWISASYSRQTLEHTIKHNKLSVEPRICPTTAIDYTNNIIQLIFENKGLGSAIFESLNIYYKARVYKSFNKIFEENGIKINDDTQFFSFYENHIISSNESTSVFKHKCKDYDELMLVIKFVKEARIDMKYECMYGVKQTFNNYLDIEIN